jgi:transcriptional regulator
MFRKDLIPLLEKNAMSVTQIARAMDESPKDIESDLLHLFQSLKHGEYRAEVNPAVCRKCGFVFSPDKLRKPSKCPECKSTWLTEPEISISKKENS